MSWTRNWSDEGIASSVTPTTATSMCAVAACGRAGAGHRSNASCEKRLRLAVNREKSAVDRPWKRKFLGYTFTMHYQPKLKVAPESVKRFKGRLREMFRRGRGRSLRRVLAELRPVLIGWVSYYRKSEVRVTFEQLDQWIRRKLRAILWRQWKRPWTRASELIRRGLARQRAWILRDEWPRSLVECRRKPHEPGGPDSRPAASLVS